MFQLRYLIFILSLFYCVEEAFAQINLVPNPSFEQLSQCPTSLSQLEYASFWFQPTDGTQFNPDLFSMCCTNTNCGHINSKGVQSSRTGNSHTGAVYFVDFFTSREFIEVKLLDSLNMSKSYCIKFYVSLADNSSYATSNFGVYLSEDSCLSSNAIPSYVAQIQNISSNVISSKTNWIPIELEYLADGKEIFITIGGFEPDSTSNTIFIGGTTTYAYYYIDDVSVIDISTPAYAGVDTTITIGDSIFIGRQPEIGLNDDCIWYVNGSPIDTVAGLWVMPDSITTYILEQTICGYTTYDTVTVTVLPTSINELFKENNLKIFPNPNNGTFTIEYNLSHENYVLEIVDVMGKVVYQERFNTNNQQEIKLSTLNIGIYFVRIMNEFSIYSTKVNIIK